jgi:hypothetical protein
MPKLIVAVINTKSINHINDCKNSIGNSPLLCSNSIIFSKKIVKKKIKDSIKSTSGKKVKIDSQDFVEDFI